VAVKIVAFNAAVQIAGVNLTRILSDARDDYIWIMDDNGVNR
jgi:hypothetical protein